MKNMGINKNTFTESAGVLKIESEERKTDDFKIPYDVLGKNIWEVECR